MLGSTALLRKACFCAALTSMLVAGSGAFGRADAAAASIAGKVVDDATGVPIVGATVVASVALLDGAPAGAPEALTTTDANGSFVLSGLPSDPKFFVQIFAPDAHATVRRTVDAAQANAQLALVRVVLPTAAEARWLDLMNAQRKAYHLTALRFEDSALRAARRWAQFQLTHNLLEHEVAGANESGLSLATPVERYRNLGGPSDAVGLAENIAQLSEASFAEAQRLWFDEGRACGNSADSCGKMAEAAGHFLNIIDPKARFVGLGMASGKVGSFYDALFVDAADDAQ